MFPKKARYTFSRSLPKKALYFPSFTVRFGKNDENLKVAVVVSKKVDNRATTRNRIKRLFLEKIKAFINIESNLDLVFYVKKQALASETIEKDLQEAFNKITNVRDL